MFKLIMSKNAMLRKQIREIINSEKIEKPKRMVYKSPPSAGLPSIEVKKRYDLRQLLQEDIHRSAVVLTQNPLTRDISHLQDRLLQTQLSLPILPMDIDVLKKLHQPEHQNIHTAYRCKREDCIDTALLQPKKTDLNSVESMEKQMLGNPTGRQDIKELCTWFNIVLETYKDTEIDNIMLIYEICAQELIRQVSVSCIERGELLKVLMNHQPQLYQAKLNALLQEQKKILEVHQKELEKLRISNKKKIEVLEEKLKEYKNDREINLQEKKNILLELGEVKKKFSDTLTKFTDEEKVWKNKHYSLLLKLKTNYSAINKQVYQLSVLRLKPSEDSSGLLENPVEKSIENSQELKDNLLITQEILMLDSDFKECLMDHQKFLQELQENTIDIEKNTADDIAKYEDKEVNESIIPEAAEEQEGELPIKVTDQIVVESHYDNFTNALSPTLDSNYLKSHTKSQLFEISKTEKIEIYKPLSCGNLEMLSRLPPLLTKEHKRKSGLEIVANETISILPESFRGDSIWKSATFPSQIEFISEETPDISPRNNAELLNPQTLVINELTSMVSPKSLQSANKKKRKINPKFPLFNKRGSKDQAAEVKSVPTNKEQELNQIIESLKQQLLEKDMLLSEHQLNNHKNFAAKPIDKLKLGIVELSQRQNPQLRLHSLLSDQSSPRNSSLIMTSLESPKDIEGPDETLMPPGCDYISWKTGYSLGVEKARRDIIAAGEKLGIQENDIESIANDSDEEDMYMDPKSPKFTESGGSFQRFPSLTPNSLKMKTKELTKIIQFQFSRPSINHIKKIHPVNTLLSKFVGMSKESLISRCTLSRKMVNRMMHLIYMTCVAKLKNGDTIDSLVEQVYDDFYQKYGLRQVCDKRFTEFIGSLLNYSSFRRISVFLRFIHCAFIIEKPNYSKITFLYYLGALQYMLATKIGFIAAFDEISDRQMFPVQRAIECVKEKLERILDRNAFNQLVAHMQTQADIDTKGNNAGGLIELELVLESIADLYETYQMNIQQGVTLVFNGFGTKDQIKSFELLVVLRHVSFDQLDFTEDEGTKRLNYHQLLKEVESKEVYSYEETLTKCREFGLLKLSDIQVFCPLIDELSVELVNNEINTSKEQCERIANYIGSNGAKYKTMEGVQFLSKMQEIQNQVCENNIYLSLFMWRLCQSELKRVKADFLYNLVFM